MSQKMLTSTGTSAIEMLWLERTGRELYSPELSRNGVTNDEHVVYLGNGPKAKILSLYVPEFE